MIDLGLTKLALIGVVALVVIGPEKLPRVARMAGSLFGRAQRYINEVKSEVSREIELDELRKMQKEVQDAAQEVGQSISQGMSEVESDIHSAWNGERGADGLSDPPTVDDLALKAKNFRRKKLARSSAVPGWYKNQTGRRAHVMSGAARMARHRAKRATPASFF
ncbi:Sec-independent protein translocase protein TatB [Undibacterium sp.]|jgi:sec-independent protein translocase protein TatB|uniref:Sec-independent protein translocase protein TatB n=1 Tax=Undibacterium sp. TaxID=1914977 RepID=UPI002CFDCFBD|nr:Sec-independent protein translocase protein TatB [Undibacterium sp.]HTD02932.1 Sec-independent protein translocase protein TatB [Undibacterium sp.]